MEVDRYFSEYVLRERFGKDDEDEEEEEVKDGMKDSRAPREGVEADNVPLGWAVRNVPLNNQLLCSFAQCSVEAVQESHINMSQRVRKNKNTEKGDKDQGTSQTPPRVQRVTTEE